MAGESQQVPKSEPDPTVLTTQQLDRGLESERDYVKGEIRVIQERLRGIDIATQLLSATVTRVPTDVQIAVQNLKELHNERFDSIATQFQERDTRSERESRDNKVAVDAAFAAQKEAASEQNKSNTLAIDKSEKATAETLNKQADLFQSSIKGIESQIVDLKERITGLETTTRTENLGRDQKRLDVGLLIGAVALVVSAIAVIVTIVISAR